MALNSPAYSIANANQCNFGLDNHGLYNLGTVYWNLPVPALYEEAVFRGEANIAKGGALQVTTGKHTARSADDKFIVRESSSQEHIWWDNNKALTEDNFDTLMKRAQAFCQGRDLFVVDAFVGADIRYQIPIRIITDSAWQSLFVYNMFINPKNQDEYKKHKPEFTLIAIPGFSANPEIDGTRTETVITLNFAKKMALVAGTNYAGETKKTFFTLMNYFKPLEKVMSMHCSANVGKDGDAALFFGLSGTGKTTLSADPNRFLIGDDEHGWSDDGIFNYEGGCYAKVINLSKESEPEIYATTQMFGTVLENVVLNPITRETDLFDGSLTENTRASYKLETIPNSLPEKMVNSHPKNVIFLTCDATGVLPPISKLDQYQAQYQFITGYTSKIAGTEKGLGNEPKMAFSACFGAPFMVHHPFVYSNLLKEKIEKFGSNVWLVNTGWIGGKFGVGKRISIKHTRAVLNAALSGALDNVEFKRDEIFGFMIPQSCPDVPSEVLNPATAWANQDEYWATYRNLAEKFAANFKKYESGVSVEVIAAGPKI